MNKIKPNEYKCAMCWGIYEKWWSKEDSEKEAEELFWSHPDNWTCGSCLVCDICFEKINPRNHPIQLEKAKKNLI